MTATLIRRRPAGRAARRTPATMRALMAALVLLSLAWGALAGWAASVHSSAASAVLTADEPLSLDARQMYESVADADVTITATLLASARPPLKPLQRYQADVATASADLITGITLYRAQWWLTKRTNRVLSTGLVLASVVFLISAVWLAAAFLVARSDLDRGIGQGSRPAETLAQASIGVQQIRGDAVLNVISRSGDASFQQDFQATSKLVGPGPGTLLTSAASAGDGQAASLVAAAEREATSWYAANAGVYRLGVAANYAAERTMVIGTGADSSAAGYTALEGDITRAITDDQAVFRSAATAGAHALDPLEPVVIAASPLMAFGCAWGFSRRIADYR